MQNNTIYYLYMYVYIYVHIAQVSYENNKYQIRNSFLWEENIGSFNNIVNILSSRFDG